LKATLVFRIYRKDQIFVVKQFSDLERIVIGHGPEVQIDLGIEISGIHCLIEQRGNQFFLCDMGSEKGTYKGGHQILDEPILNGESFQVGSYNIIFFIGVPKPASNPQFSERVAPMFPPQTTTFSPAVANKPANSKTSNPEMSEIKCRIKSSKKNKKTFAPISEFNDLKEYIKVGKGQSVEVMVCWKERILKTYHFSLQGDKTLDKDGDINVTEGAAPKNWKLLSLQAGVVINTTSEMKMEILREGQIKKINENYYALQQAEVCFIELINGMQLVVRFAPKAPTVIFDSALILGASELTGMLTALIIAVLASLLVSVYKSKPEKLEDEERLAQVIFTTPPVVEKKKAINSPMKSAVLTEQPKEKKLTGDPTKPEQKALSLKNAGQITDAEPVKDSNLKSKMFTSKPASPAKTKEISAESAKNKQVELKSSGLLGAFGEGGARSQLDQAYSGVGKLIGASEKAGYRANNNRRDELESKTKDTGAGGAGTATQGIASLNTKGRGGGVGSYGKGVGLGEKSDIQISAGGSEESFAGSIDREAVRRTVRQALAQFKACYEREYRKNTKIAGKVVVKWDIDDKGTAKNAHIVKNVSTINNESVEECVRLRMLSLKFPEAPPGTWAEISFPFLFEGPKF